MVASLPLREVNLNVRCVVKKRYLIARIGELGQELSLCTNRREVLLCWDKLENLGEDVSKFHPLLNDNGDTAVSADVQDKVGLTFESLKLKCRDKMNQILEQPHSEVQPEDSVSNVGTALSRSSANALTQIDLELQREELQVEAKKAQAQMQAQMQAQQMQAEFELRNAKLRAEQRRQEILATSNFREGSRISHKSRLSSRKFYSGTGPDVATIFGRSKKVDNQVVAPRTGETDVGLGAAGDASHLVEPLREIACGETALSEPWGSNAILNDISNPAAQTENYVVPSAATNPFTQKHPPVLGRDGLSASGAGKCSGPPRAKVPPGFECGFVQDSGPSEVLPPRRADCHISERVRDMNDVVVSRFPQRGDVRECALSRYPPPEKNRQTSVELHDGYQNELARNASNGRNIGFSPSSSNSSADQQNCFFEYQNCKTFMDKAALIGYDGANMPFIFFKNCIYALMDSCPFEGVRLTLLQAACARTAAQTIANLTFDTPGLSEKDRIEMSLERLSQRFGVRGGFLSEPEIRKYRYGNKLVSSSANIMKEFKDQLDQCLLYARAYNQREKLVGSFVLDWAKRLPFEAKQRYLNFFSINAVAQVSPLIKVWSIL